MGSDTATFRATLPPILSAIRMAGDGGMRIMFDIDESGMPEALKLLMWKGQVLKVTIEPESMTEFDGEAKKGTEGSGDSMDCRRVAIRRDQ